MTERKYPYRGGLCFLIPKRYGQGWQVDMEIDGEIIDAIYTNAEASSKEQAVQEATRPANDIMLSRHRVVLSPDR